MVRKQAFLLIVRHFLLKVFHLLCILVPFLSTSVKLSDVSQQPVDLGMRWTGHHFVANVGFGGLTYMNCVSFNVRIEMGKDCQHTCALNTYKL